MVQQAKTQTLSQAPDLLAFLICEKALLDEDKVVSLIRVVDTFNFRLEVVGMEAPQLDRLAVTLNCAVVTRWGIGEGEFTEEIRLADSSGKEHPLGKTTFTKEPGFHFQNIRHDVQLVLTKPGLHAFLLYLNGALRGKHPFQVNIERKAGSAPKLERS